MQEPSHEPAAPVVILVNDNALQLKLMVRLLLQEGLAVRDFPGAEAALAAMEAAPPPDLIVTDLYMPGIDGWRFCRLLRSPEFAAYNKVPILVVSATYAGDEPDLIAANLGAEAFLAAPIDGRRFVEQVLGILKGARVPRLPGALVVEDSRSLARHLVKTFQEHGYRADLAQSLAEATEALARNPYEVAVLDYYLPDGLGDSLLDLIQKDQPGCVSLMMTIDPGPELAVAWMKRGAAYYLRKPFKGEYLIELCARARRERALLRVQDILEIRTKELRKSEARLQESEGRLRAILNAIPDLMFLFDGKGVFLDCHAPGGRSLLLPREQFLGRAIQEVLPPELAGPTLAHIEEIRTCG